jgi:hypothetical protein
MTQPCRGLAGHCQVCGYGGAPTWCNYVVRQDDIRRHTTPSHRAPELWDLQLRLPVDHRVDLWVRRPGRAPAPCLNTWPWPLCQRSVSRCRQHGNGHTVEHV